MLLDRTETTGIHEPSPAASDASSVVSRTRSGPRTASRMSPWPPGRRRSSPPTSIVALTFAGLALRIPILASAMDAVVDVRSAGVLSGLGGVAVLNLEGVQPR